MPLYIVATPIGNLEDITLRALRILGEVDMVICEDTRVSGKLLHHYNIKKPLLSYHANATDVQEEKIITMMSNGKTLALVTDAGTPCISDPGVRLIDRLHRELPDAEIVSVPGPSAITAALSISGISTPHFMFLGFVPTKKGRETFFQSIKDSVVPVVFYESTHRVMKTFESLAGKLQPERMVVVARELTKMHEELIRGSAAEILEYFTQHPDHQRGEYVIIVDVE